MTEGNTIPTSSSYGMEAEDVWIGYKLIQLQQGGTNPVKFKPNTTYHILIEAPSKGEIEITTDGSKIYKWYIVISLWEAKGDFHLATD